LNRQNRLYRASTLLFSIETGACGWNGTYTLNSEIDQQTPGKNMNLEYWQLNLHRPTHPHTALHVKSITVRHFNSGTAYPLSLSVQ